MLEDFDISDLISPQELHLGIQTILVFGKPDLSGFFNWVHFFHIYSYNFQQPLLKVL